VSLFIVSFLADPEIWSICGHHGAAVWIHLQLPRWPRSCGPGERL